MATTATQTLLKPILHKIKPINKTFRELVPYENLVNPGVINDFANEQVNPDAYAQAAGSYRNTLGNLYRQGGNRFGGGQQKLQQNLNTSERARQDTLGQFRNLMEGNLADTYRQYELGFNEDPNAGWVSDFMNPYKTNPNQSTQNLASMYGYQNQPSGYSALPGMFRGY